MTDVCPLESSWERRLRWKRSLRTWTRMGTAASPNRYEMSLIPKEFGAILSIQEFLRIAKHLTPEQVEEGFSKFDTSGDNK